MRRHFAAIALVFAASILSASAQPSTPAAEAPTAAQVPAGTAAAAAQPKLDALLMYRQGRDLETAGKQSDAQAKYTQAVSVCDQELAADPRRLEAYVVKCWSLFRLGRHAEVISSGQSGLKISIDGRISEVMGESYYFLGQMESCIKSLQRYIEISGDSGDRGPTAYFFMGEAYLRLKKYSHADIAYSMAVLKEPSMSRWWFRLGNACESLGEWKRSLDAYNKAIALNPSYQEAIAAQGRVKPKVSP
jgi:tetratricopeptide (TPR) repeat protein